MLTTTAYRQSLLIFLTLVLLLLPKSGAAQDSDETTLEECSHPIGTLAVMEPQRQTLYALRRYDLQSPTSLIRMMVQQSNCFVVVERGEAMQNMRQERDLARSGELQQGENVGAGQMKAADFILTPDVIFSEGNAGGVGGAIGGLLGRRSRTVGALAGGLKFKEAQTSILISDTRSGVQIAAAEGKAQKKDFRLGMISYGGGVGTAMGGYTNTNEGKVIAASFLDNFNNIVLAVRADPNLQQLRANVQPGQNVKAGAVYAEGDVLVPKIDNVQILSQPAEGARVVATLKKTDELVFLGSMQEGYLYVQGSEGGGWVKVMLVAKK